ncbi:hypothetical protein HGRIS_012800 [Hohenbuehelia grisea]|uniref:Uncharacterized protein n=1 Tax=Hohenbuehelia grisea TaxID=104357 RepID=A0ABR3ITQ4_9AGAR
MTRRFFIWDTPFFLHPSTKTPSALLPMPPAPIKMRYRPRFHPYDRTGRPFNRDVLHQIKALLDLQGVGVDNQWNGNGAEILHDDRERLKGWAVSAGFVVMCFLLLVTTLRACQ